MILFLDTEFSDLSPGMEVLSLALVSLDGKYEFYGERNDVPAERCSEFVRQEVLPQLQARPPYAGDLLNLRARLREFVEGLPEQARLACDSHFDMSHVSNVLGKPWPKTLSGERMSLQEWKEKPVFAQAQERYHDGGRPYHHALSDARGLRAGYLAWQKNAK